MVDPRHSALLQASFQRAQARLGIYFQRVQDLYKSQIFGRLLRRPNANIRQ